MIQQCVDFYFSNDRVIVDDIELKRTSVSWTIDTVNEYINKGVGSLYLIIGSDSFFQFHTWKDYKLLLDKVTLIVFGRGRILEDRLYDYLTITLGVQDQNKIIFHEFEDYKLISSTQVRDRLYTNANMLDFVPEIILNYIESHSLYK